MWAMMKGGLIRLGSTRRRTQDVSQRLSPRVTIRSSFSTGTSQEPYYGSPRPAALSGWDRLSLLLGYATAAVQNPARADAVAAVGELTGRIALQQLRQVMQQNETGRRILLERPLVTHDQLPSSVLNSMKQKKQSNQINARTFGQAYGHFLAGHGFDPDDRDPVRYIQCPELAYIMQRYRQCHDFWHVLTGLPTTVTGELGLKWLEHAQTGLPMCAGAVWATTPTLTAAKQEIVWKEYVPWAEQAGRAMPFGTIMNVYYELEYDTPLDELRARMGMQVAPLVTTRK